MCSVYIFLVFLLQVCDSLDVAHPNQSIGYNETVISPNGTFELGFFSLSSSRNYYLGIHYKKASASAVVWVANRETPLMDSFGVLTLTKEGVLVLVNSQNRTIWSSIRTRQAHNPVMQLLESGNLVVKERNGSDSDSYLWQSFDYPCDTLLPGMKLGKDLVTGLERHLTSWKAPDDPAKGQFSYQVDLHGFPQLLVKNGTSIYYRVGSWNGIRFTGTPDLPTSLQFFIYEFVINKKEVYYSYEVKSLLMSRLLLNNSGSVVRFARLDQTIGWRIAYVGPMDGCDLYSVCGENMICNVVNNSSRCECLEGFVRHSPARMGCTRRIQLGCETDVFRNYSGFKLPDTSSSWFDTSMNLEECEKMCRENCSCTAFANTNITGQGNGCLLWFGDFIDVRVYTEGGQDIFIRMSSSKPGDKRLLVILTSIAALIGSLVVGLICYIFIKRSRNKGNHLYFGSTGEEENMELPIIELATISKATEDFSSNNKLGQGGFGPVYKGTLISGQEIAVKRMSKTSAQGLTEFKNEVVLIAKLQHRNLVKLLGCCIQGEEALLVYEFMPNKSLDHFIFDQTQKRFLDWNKRVLIIDGIARGLLYLHQDSRLRIIHRDLKASNVLLDANMNPKISDFGMARMFGGDEMEANTKKVVGTYGYMSPEYAIDGLFSTKSDVFSFGVLVLEIVSGQKNRGFSNPDHSHNLLGHAWILWSQDRSLKLIDNSLDCMFPEAKLLRCIHVGLLCVQQNPKDRPNMSSVVLMLASENPLPQPKQPGFFTERNVLSEIPSHTPNSSSTNEMSITSMEAR